MKIVTISAVYRALNAAKGYLLLKKRIADAWGRSDNFCVSTPSISGIYLVSLYTACPIIFDAVTAVYGTQTDLMII
jgi:hypothetical protein